MHDDNFFSFMDYMTVVFLLVECVVLGVIGGVSYGIYCVVGWFLHMSGG